MSPRYDFLFIKSVSLFADSNASSLGLEGLLTDPLSRYLPGDDFMVDFLLIIEAPVF